MGEKVPASLTQPSSKKTGTKGPDRQRKSRLDLHQAHCGICSHELRDEIDEAFVSWECVHQIATDYRLHRSALYRHAHAVGLFRRRRRNLRCALELVIQEAERTSPTADATRLADSARASPASRPEIMSC